MGRENRTLSSMFLAPPRAQIAAAAIEEPGTWSMPILKGRLIDDRAMCPPHGFMTAPPYEINRHVVNAANVMCLH